MRSSSCGLGHITNRLPTRKGAASSIFDENLDDIRQSRTARACVSLRLVGPCSKGTGNTPQDTVPVLPVAYE